MTKAELRALVLESLGSVAPEVDLASLRGDVRFQDQFDLDSIDFLRYVIELDQRLHVEVPEVDYPKVATLDGAVDYLTERRAASADAERTG